MLEGFWPNELGLTRNPNFGLRRVVLLADNRNILVRLEVWATRQRWCTKLALDKRI